jgi:shikimate kinase
MNAATREAVARRGVSVWLKADLDLLMERVGRNQNRPLLKTPDPRAVMARLMGERHPVYAQADITVESRDARREIIADEALLALAEHLETEHAGKGG